MGWWHGSGGCGVWYITELGRWYVKGYIHEQFMQDVGASKARTGHKGGRIQATGLFPRYSWGTACIVCGWRVEA